MENILTIPIDEAITSGTLDDGLFVFVIHVKRIPPHLGLIYNGKVYDINIRGKKIGIPVTGFIDVLKSKNIPGLFFKIDVINKRDIEEIIKHQISIFDQVNMDVTCLAPVKGVIDVLYNNKANRANFVFELIPMLYDQNLVTKTVQFGLDEDLVDGIFKFQKYTLQDIQNQINRLNQKPVANQ